MKYTLGFSPCPNDTFIFDAMIHGKIDTEGLKFEVIMEDVEALNKRAFAGKIDITKLSYHAFAHLIKKYQLLNAGSALGNNCGPLLIAKQNMTANEINAANIVIPGKMTTANFLLNMAFPNAQNKTAVVFSDIEPMVLSGEADAGLIIHENRFTYEQKGLVKIMDLGEYWEATTGLPIPLGGIVVKRKMPQTQKLKIDRVLRRSVEYAFAHTSDVMPFVKAHAQEMDEAVMKSHINLYVSDFTIDLGERGRASVQKMFEIAKKSAIIFDETSSIFLN
jgi:1,4-dihydroxy-6-naphthoate synthase